MGSVLKRGHIDRRRLCLRAGYASGENCQHNKSN